MSNPKSYFQSKKRHTLIAIGYWHSIFEPEYPDPAWFIDEKWDVNARNLVIAHLSQSHPLADWTGQSWCRFRCGETQMGSKDYTDGTYIFPEGLIHYLNIHQVRLPEVFVQHVQQYKPFTINFGLEHCEINYTWWLSQRGWHDKYNSFTAPNDEVIESYRQWKQKEEE